MGCGNKDNTALGPYYDMACNGGWIDNALYYVMQTGYLDNYDDYPYVSGNTRQAGSCVSDPSTSAGNIFNCGATAKTLKPNFKPLFPKSVPSVLLSMLVELDSNCTLVEFILLLLVHLLD